MHKELSELPPSPAFDLGAARKTEIPPAGPAFPAAGPAFPAAEPLALAEEQQLQAALARLATPPHKLAA